MTTGDLLLVAIPILPLRTGAVPNGLAVKWHGLLLDQLRRLDPALAATMHDLQRKPFTIAPLLDTPGGIPLSSVEEGERVWLQTAIVDAWLPDLFPALEAPRRWMSDLWLNDVLLCLPERLPMRTAGPSPWDFVLDRRISPVWMQQSGFEELASAPGPYPSRWRITLHSPTTFRLSLPGRLRGVAPDLCLPLPDPELILRSLAGAWQHHAPRELADLAAPDLVADLLLRIELDGYRADGVRADLGPRESHAAFVGDATLAYRPGPREPFPDREQRLRLLAMLLGLVPFTGIGIKTARGMGYASIEAID